MRRFWPILIGLFLAIQQADAFIDVSLQMQLGNPSGATVNTNNHDHYLIQRSVEAIDYSDNLGEPVWASWDLTSGDVGSATRSPTYFTDTNLPANFYPVTTIDYNGVGAIDFNRGHLCPSEDRTDSRADNDAVFLMSNIMPQSGPNNQGVWANLETYCRTLASAGNELLIICGPSDFGSRKLPSGKAYIASNVWKIIVSVPLGNGTALSRLSATNRVIAVSIPNVTNGLVSTWQTYVTSPRQIELNTGFTFFSAVPADIATTFRAKVDGSLAPGITNISPASGSAGSVVVIRGTNFAGASVVWFNGSNANFTINSSNQISATVPAEASTGPIAVFAPGGRATSVGNFIVSHPAMAPAFSLVTITNNQFQFTVTGTAGSNYVVQATTSLTALSWTALITNAAPFQFIESNVNLFPQRFYRATIAP